MTKFPIICTKCGTVSVKQHNEYIQCEDCGNIISRIAYENLISFGYNIVHYGVNYRKIYEHDYEVHGNFPSRYSIVGPSILLSFIAGAIAGGIIGNASYDFIIYCLRGLVKSLRNKTVNKQLGVYGDAFSNDKDIILLLDILENKENAIEFREYINEYLNGMRNVNPKVRSLIISEESIRAMISAVQDSIDHIYQKSTNRKYVYVTKTGRKYHAHGCRHLIGKSRRIEIILADRIYTACKTCIT